MESESDRLELAALLDQVDRALAQRYRAERVRFYELPVEVRAILADRRNERSR